MKKILCFTTIILALLSHEAHAQYTRYIIRLKDKGSNPYTLSNPVQYLSVKAVERRTRYNIAIDSTDLPVTPRYIDSIRLAGDVTILNVSKWLNQVAIRTSDAAALAKINAMPFVINASGIGSFAGSIIVPVNKQLDADFTQGNAPAPPSGPVNFVQSLYDYGKSNGQVKIHQGNFLHDHGFRGEGMQITVLDAGFYHYLSLPTFDSLRVNNQILGTWDFVDNEASVDEDYDHGMKCLSTIGANMPGVFIGTAPKTSFYLYRTEDVFSEYPIEEQNWAAGIERADSLGVPVSSTSLGYNQFDNPALNYTYADMNGNTTISARAADFAAKKGMLVVIAAGNTGNDPWHYLITPSDADSVLCIGAVDTLGNVASFSAYGPSSDGQIKPSVAAVGSAAYVASTSSGLPEIGFGTSYACPNMAGLVTCLWQAFPEVNNMAIIDATQQSSTKATAPDNRVGYGIPDMKKAFALLVKKLYTQNAALSFCHATVNFSVKIADGMNVEIERKTFADNNYTSVKNFAGSSAFSTQNFTFADDLSFAPYGPVKYRMKMTIGTDTTFYIDSLTVAYVQSCLPSVNKISIGPNPVVGNLYIQIERTTAAKVDMVIVNALGQKVFSKTVQQAAGFAVENVPMAGMSRGVYFVSIFIDGKKEVVKEIVR